MVREPSSCFDRDQPASTYASANSLETVQRILSFIQNTPPSLARTAGVTAWRCHLLYPFAGIEHLDLLFGRMSEHISKKTPQLRPFQS